MGTVIAVEFVNLVLLLTNETILDIIMNFLAVVVLSEIDDFFFNIVKGSFFG